MKDMLRQLFRIARDFVSAPSHFEKTNIKFALMEDACHRFRLNVQRISPGVLIIQLAA